MFFSSFNIGTRLVKHEDFNVNLFNDYLNTKITSIYDFKINLSSDEIFTFICEIFKSNKLLEYDGYFGADWINKKIDDESKKSSNNIEYVIFDPNILTFLGVYYYDYYTNKFILYRNINDWTYKLNKLIKDYSTLHKKGIKDNIEFNIIDINKYYIKNLDFITSDLLILKDNDFWNGSYKPIEFIDDIIQ